MLRELILRAVNGPEAPGPWDAYKPVKPRGRFRCWVDYGWWELRCWLGDKCQSAADRLYGLGPLDPLPPEPAPAEPPALTVEPPPPAPDLLDLALAAGTQHVHWCDSAAEWRLAQDIARHFDLEFQPVWNALGALPPNQLHLLDNPLGWSMIADWAAAQVTGTRPDCAAFIPPIH